MGGSPLRASRGGGVSFPEDRVVIALVGEDEVVDLLRAGHVEDAHLDAGGAGAGSGQQGFVVDRLTDEQQVGCGLSAQGRNHRRADDEGQADRQQQFALGAALADLTQVLQARLSGSALARRRSSAAPRIHAGRRAARSSANAWSRRSGAQKVVWKRVFAVRVPPWVLMIPSPGRVSRDASGLSSANSSRESSAEARSATRVGI